MMIIKGIYDAFILNIVLLSSLFFVLFSSSSSNGQITINPHVKVHKESYTLAVVPQFPPVEIHKRWTPFAEMLSKELNVSIQLRVYKDFKEFENDIRKGVPDFIYMNPYQAVVAKKTHGYIPLARDKKLIKAVVFVHKDSPIQTLQDLNGKEIAFVAPSTICSIVLRHELSTGKEKINFIPKYSGTASNVFRNVILDKIPAGGTLDTPLNREPAEVRAQLKTVHETQPMASHPITAHPRIPEGLRQAVIDAVLKIAGDKNSSGILKDIQMPEPVRADYQKDYMPLERLGLEKYLEGGQ